MVVSILIPRFELTVAAGGSEPLVGRAIALSPVDSGDGRIGDASPTAEAKGARKGMRIGEALGRCPELVLVQPDPVGVAVEWEGILSAIEGIGALVESPCPGHALFEGNGLLRMHGGLRRLLAATSLAVARPVRIGAAPSRFAAVVASTSARPRRPVIVEGGMQAACRFLAPHPVSTLERDPRTRGLPTLLERLGIHTLGELAVIPADAVTDRFGEPGTVARDLAHGHDSPVVPRAFPLALAETLELPEAASAGQLDHALDLLIRRLLSRPERDCLTLRAVDLAAGLDTGGTWSKRVCFREPLADRRRMMLALSTVFEGLPSPARSVRLAAVSFGPPTADQRSLFDEPAAARIERLRQAILQSRQLAGAEPALRAVEIEPDSRLPERRMALVPFEA